MQILVLEMHCSGPLDGGPLAQYDGRNESQKEVHKLNAKISQQAADVARYQRRIEKLRELLSKAGRLLERALTSSRWRFGSLVLFRSSKFAGESDPRWRKRLLGEFKAWIQQGGEYQLLTQQKIRARPTVKLYLPQFHPIPENDDVT